MPAGRSRTSAGSAGPTMLKTTLSSPDHRPHPEVEPARPWQRLPQNRRGAVIDRALRRHTGAVVCRLRLRT
ncbi:hypothetical protein [Kitasatospora sp. NPDC085879]|uniref:hypothetical protein n=1 Tax=Kitasatospora sp. NPDC085879 TaxID=3154769 RepID=UPI00341C64EC